MNKNRVREKINALGYPEPEENFEYICDNNVEIFRNRASMIPGKAVVDGHTITVNGASGVAAYEVQDADGGVVYVSTYNKFTVENLRAGWVLKAVPYKGEKVTVAID